MAQMSHVPMNWLTALVKQHEGFRPKIYIDTTGHPTIGYGINLDEGITEDEATMILTSRLSHLVDAIPAPDTLSQARVMVLCDMAYNLGIKGLMAFRKMWAAIHDGEYDRAADEMLASRWADQVGHRAIQDAEIMRTGILPPELTP